MFIYFPEYAYNRIKKYLKFSFNSLIYEEKTKSLLISKLNDINHRETLEEFKIQKINLPKIELNFCKSFLFKEPDVNLGILSSYDRIKNKIKICHNYIESLDQLSSILDKELAYALMINLPIMQRKLSLNDYSKLSIKACRKMLKNTRESEIIKRCAYLDMKYRNYESIKSSYEDEITDNLKINEIVRKLIDSNFNS